MAGICGGAAHYVSGYDEIDIILGYTEFGNEIPQRLSAEGDLLQPRCARRDLLPGVGEVLHKGRLAVLVEGYLSAGGTGVDDENVSAIFAHLKVLLFEFYQISIPVP